MELTPDQLEIIIKLFGVIKSDLRHKWYDRTVKKSKLYKQCITGEDIGDLVKKYCPAQDEKTVEKMIACTNPILKCITHRLIAIDEKIPRSNSITTAIGYTGSEVTDDEDKRIKDFENKVLSKFWGEKSLESYLGVRLIELINRDPNAWIACEWTPSDGTKLSEVYPFEILSENALYFEYKQYRLQYLIAADGNDFIYYGKEQNLKFKFFATVSDELGKPYADAVEGEIIGAGTEQYIVIKKNVYLIIAPEPHKIGFVPVIRCGAARDQYTEGETFVSTFDKAIPFLMNSIKSCVERDISEMQLAFPDRWQYERSCAGETCRDGRLPNGDTCPICEGKGTQTLISNTAFNTTHFPLPKPGDPLTPLSDLVYFHYPPPEILDHLNKYIDDIFYNCLRVIYNTEVFDKKEISDTATGKMLDYQNLYDVLYKTAEHYAGCYEFFVRVSAKVTGFYNEKFMVRMSIGKDFAMETMDDLVFKFEQQKKAGCPFEIISATENQMMKIKAVDEPAIYEKYTKKNRFKPFRDKSQTEIALILNSDSLASQDQKILYVNWEMIWQRMEDKSVVDIYNLSDEKLQLLIDAEIKTISDKIKADKPVTSAFNKLPA